MKHHEAMYTLYRPVHQTKMLANVHYVQKNACQCALCPNLPSLLFTKYTYTACTVYAFRFHRSTDCHNEETWSGQHWWSICLWFRSLLYAAKQNAMVTWPFSSPSHQWNWRFIYWRSTYWELMKLSIIIHIVICILRCRGRLQGKSSGNTMFVGWSRLVCVILLALIICYYKTLVYFPIHAT